MIRALVNLLLNITDMSRAAARGAIRLIPRRGPGTRRYVQLSLPSGVELRGKPRKIGPVTIGVPARGSWWALDELLERAAEDRDIEGIYFKAEKGPASLASASAVAERVGRLRRSGKRIVCHLDQGMLGDYLLATAADTVMMTPPGRLYTFGMRLELSFLAEAFEKAGISAQFVNLGRYKTAAHRFTRGESTAPQRIMMQQLLYGFGMHTADRIAKRRAMSPDKARALFERAPMSARDARRLGFVDQLVYADEIKTVLGKESDCDRPVKIIPAKEYMATSHRPFKWRPLSGRGPQVAVLELKGMIMQGNEGGVTKGLRNALTPKPVIKTLKRLAKDKNVKAVVLRIDSPGGSALASDLMWRQIQKLAEKKPVIASLGHVAGSGGYYIAVAAHEIVAHPESITGSIGVIAGKLSGGALLEKLGVNIESLTETDSNFMSMTSALTESEMINLRRDIRAFYRRFLHRVATGRGMPRRKVHRLARGRVYTGSRAKALGLVDHLGDLEKAIEIACERADLARDAVEVRFVDHQKPAIKGLLGRFGPKAELDAASALMSLIPEDLHPQVAAAMLMRQPSALALMPYLG